MLHLLVYYFFSNILPYAPCSRPRPFSALALIVLLIRWLQTIQVFVSWESANKSCFFKMSYTVFAVVYLPVCYLFIVRSHLNVVVVGMDYFQSYRIYRNKGEHIRFEFKTHGKLRKGTPFFSPQVFVVLMV